MAAFSVLSAPLLAFGLLASSWREASSSSVCAADQVLLQTNFKHTAEDECKTPMQSACSILSGVPEACCSSSKSLATETDTAQYCQACEGVENEWIAREVQDFCPADAAPSFAQMQQSTSRAGVRLMRMLRSKAAALELLQAAVAPADVCKEEPGDCVLQVDAHFKAIFKEVGHQGPCCSSLQPIIASTEDPDSTVVSSFCNACRAARSDNADVDNLFQTLCPVHASA